MSDNKYAVDPTQAAIERVAEVDYIRQLERERDEREKTLGAIRDLATERLATIITLTEALRSAESTLALMAEGEGNRAEVYQRMSKAELADVRAALARAGVE